MPTALLPVHHQTERSPDADVTPGDACLVDWLRLIRAEYEEFPGLRLTGKQARRLWNLDSVTCDALLDSLVNVRFLRRTETGAYARAD
jgi:hypothetical protein